MDNRDLLENVMNATTNLIFYKDCDLRYIGCNDAFAEFVGIPKERIIGHNDFELFDEAHAERFRKTDSDIIAKKETIHHEKWVKYPDGRDVYQHTTKSPLYDKDGNIFGLMGISRDFTFQKQLQEQLKGQHRYIQSILDSVDSLIFITGDGVHFTDANRAFYEFFGGKVLASGVIPESVNVKKEGFVQILSHPKWFRTLIARDSKEYVKVQYTRPYDDHVRIFSLKVTRLSDSEDYMVTLSDITEIEHERLFYEERSKIDGLTETFNRRTVIEALNGLIERCRNGGCDLSIIMIDIDHFKQINDVYGHQGGDHILREVSDVIRKSIRKNDIFGRYGGEEFLIVLPGQDRDAAIRIAEKVRCAVEARKFSYNGRLIAVTVSLGMAGMRDDDDEKTLLKRADDALYLSKRDGRNRATMCHEE